MEILVGAFILGLIPAFIAQSKGRDFLAWWVYGFLILIVALPHSIIIKPDKKKVEERELAQGMKKCPFCAELIKGEAIKCRFCGSEIPVMEAKESVVVESKLPDLDPNRPWACTCGEVNLPSEGKGLEYCHGCGMDRGYTLLKIKALEGERAKTEKQKEKAGLTEERHATLTEKEGLKIKLTELEKKEEKCLSYLNEAVEVSVRESWAGELASVRLEKERIAGLLGQEGKT